MINKNKCFFYLHEKSPVILAYKKKRWIRINQGFFPFTYLGCPVFYGKKKKSQFEELLVKVTRIVMTYNIDSYLMGENTL